MSDGLQVGTRIVINGESFCIDEILLSIGTIRLVGKGGVRLEITSDDFYNKCASGEIQTEQDLVSNEIRKPTTAEETEANFREEIVVKYRKMLEGFEKKSHIEAELKKFCYLKGHKNVRLRTVREYSKAYGKNNFNALIPNYVGRGGKGWSSKEELVKFVEAKAKEIYFSQDNVSKTSFYLMVDELIRQEFGIPKPEKTISESTCIRIIDRLPAATASNGRLEKKTLNLEQRKSLKKYRGCRAFAIAELDAAEVPVYSVDEFGNKHTEVTVYLIRDVRTSYPLAVYVMAGKPCEMGFYKVLEQFYSPRTEEFYQKLGVEGISIVSPAHISTLVIDNAAEHFGKLVSEVIRRVSTVVKNTRQYRGDDKGYVESGHGILWAMLYSFMPGVKKSQDKRVKERGKRAEAEACYTVEEIFKETLEFFYGSYINGYDVELGFLYGKPMTIAQAMEEELKLFMPLPPPSLESFKKLMALMHCEQRVVHHYGVEYGGFKFYGGEMARYVDEKNLKSVNVYYNPADCTRVYVSGINDNSGTLIEVPNKTIGVPEISFDDAAILRTLYAGGNRIMTGQDYQRLRGKQLIRFYENSKKPAKKIKDQNKIVRKNTKNKFNTEVGEELASAAIAPKSLVIPELEHDDDIVPAPWSNEIE
ncbi:MAG: Mu transposase C-terminal domain-containing protein [Pseudomonas sp.]|nr:Mu transposase C-terminal domain-containing protein [Pseudomonas sp.]